MGSGKTVNKLELIYNTKEISSLSLLGDDIFICNSKKSFFILYCSHLTLILQNIEMSRSYEDKI